MISAIFKKLKNKKGFTLVELIVVVAILAIIATVAVPKVIGFRDDATAARNATNEQLVRNAAAIWIAEHGTPNANVTWDTDDSASWGDYLDEWPEGVTSVTINTDGDISVVMTP